MPTVRAGDIDVYYETQGSGEPLVLIPYLALDQACNAFQVADYTKHYTCISVNLPSAGQTSKPDGSYTTDVLADDLATLMQAIRVERAHVSGLSLGAATDIWLAAKYPEKVKTLSLHSAWPKTDPFLGTAVPEAPSTVWSCPSAQGRSNEVMAVAPRSSSWKERDHVV